MEIREFKKDRLRIKVFENKDKLGEAAANSVAELLKKTISEKGKANLILATGASQFQFLEHLEKHEIDWKKITVFHLDEYKGMP
ncbi:MAG TPA: 6-phosphogluconolactonase, partial [Draconibacterium sp.]|nr:6-phosphogluconolactonase [Draconibacterium sp.]